LVHCNFVQHQSYMNWPGKESGFMFGKKVEHSQQIKVLITLVNRDLTLSFALKNKTV
jgi:hypothetical protein